MSQYPARLLIAFPEDGISRLSTFFRGFLMIPSLLIAIMLGLVAGLISPFLALIIFFTGRYPRRLYEFFLDIMRFEYRHEAYAWLLTDRWAFDSTDDHPVEIMVPYPQPDGRLSRWLPLFKWLLVLPHAVCLPIGYLVGCVLCSILWVYILVTGQMANSLFQLIASLMDWNFRVAAYCFYLMVDEYPPFGDLPVEE